MGRSPRPRARPLRAAPLVAVCDPVPGAAEAAAPGRRRAPEIDACSPTIDRRRPDRRPHSPARRAGRARARRGQARPLREAPTLEVHRDVELGRLAESLGLVLQVGFWRRFAWPYREAARLLAEGAIGEPRLCGAASGTPSRRRPLLRPGRQRGHRDRLRGARARSRRVAARLADRPRQRGGHRGDAAIEAVGDVEAIVALAVTAGGRPGDDRSRPQRPLRRRRAHRDRRRARRAPDQRDRPGSLHVGDAAGLREWPSAIDVVLDDALAAQADCFARAIGGQRDPALPVRPRARTRWRPRRRCAARG